MVALLSSALSPHLYVGGLGKPRSGLKIWVGVIGDSPTDRLFPSLFVFFPVKLLFPRGPWILIAELLVYLKTLHPDT